MVYDCYMAICKTLQATRPSCNRGSASSWWWWPGLGESCMPPCRFSSQSTWPSVVSRSLITSPVISSVLQLAAATPTGFEWWWQLTQWGCFHWFFFPAPHLLHSHPELPEIPWLWRTAQVTLYMWCPLYRSGPLYMQLHLSCGHLPWGQVGGYVLCNPHSHVKSYHLHSEKHRSERCHEQLVDTGVESNLGYPLCQEKDIYVGMIIYMYRGVKKQTTATTKTFADPWQEKKRPRN